VVRRNNRTFSLFESVWGATSEIAPPRPGRFGVCSPERCPAWPAARPLTTGPDYPERGDTGSPSAQTALRPRGSDHRGDRSGRWLLWHRSPAAGGRAHRGRSTGEAWPCCSDPRTRPARAQGDQELETPPALLRIMARLRACWVTHRLSGWAVIPARVMRHAFYPQLHGCDLSRHRPSRCRDGRGLSSVRGCARPTASPTSSLPPRLELPTTGPPLTRRGVWTSGLTTKRLRS
jgi:hypothetical protein